MPLATAKRSGKLACGSRLFMPRTTGLEPFSPPVHPERVQVIIPKGNYSFKTPCFSEISSSKSW